MTFSIDIILLILLLISAILAINMKDLLNASIVFGVYGFIMCLLWAKMGAVDVAFTEAVVGAGVSTVLLIATILNTKRKSSD